MSTVKWKSRNRNLVGMYTLSKLTIKIWLSDDRDTTLVWAQTGHSVMAKIERRGIAPYSTSSNNWTWIFVSYLISEMFKTFLCDLL